MKRKLFLTLIILGVLLVAGVWIGWRVTVGYLTPDFLVAQIERKWHCRAHIDAVTVRMTGTAAVELTGLALAPRDEHAGQGKPLAERPALEAGAAPLRCESVSLEIRPAELIQRKVNIQRLTIAGLAVDTAIDRNGDATVERLFDPLPAAHPAGDETVSAMAAAGAEMEAGTFSTVADRVEVKGGQASFLVEASGTIIRLDGLELALTEIDVDPAEPAAHNRARFQFSSELIVAPPSSDQAETAEHLRGRVSGSGEAAPLNVTTGRMDPAWTCDLTLHQGTQINTFPVIDRLQKLLEGIDTAGVDLKDLNIRGTLLADANTRVAHAGGRYLIEQPLQLALPDTQLVLNDGSWLHTGTNQHEIRGQVVASEVLTRKIEGKVDAYLKKKARGLPAESLRQLVLGPVTKDGRLALEFTSSGDLAKPKADIVTPLGNLSEVIDTGKETIKTLEEVGKSLLKGLFGN
ncbi:MAG: hypothetical protein JNK37_21275 [Verrucomicrobiales bacterium]|nr:hypothetical protein [Verrucomicrobiales bacterium]